MMEMIGWVLLLQSQSNKLEDTCIQNFHLGRYIVGYMVGNFVLRRRSNWKLLMHFLTFIRQRDIILHQTEASSVT